MKKRAKTPLDLWDDMPQEMKSYLRNNGWHFNKRACEYACDLMVSNESGDKLTQWSKEEVDNLLHKYNVSVEDTNDYDYVYVANMCKADYFKSAVPDERCLCLYIKKTIEDKDASEGQVFRRWYSDMCGAGEMIFWEELL